MIDTHCHLTYEGLHERAQTVIQDAQAAGVTKLICIATSPQEAEKVLALAEKHSGVFAALGVHPHYAAQVGALDTLAEEIRRLLAHPRVVALGEMGLDLHYREPSLPCQQEVFALQLRLMREFPHLPGVIHNRQATAETLAMIRDSGIQADRFVFHCFTGTAAELNQVLDLGAMVGFTGIVTFKNGRELATASDRVPLDRLLVETDAPYLTPEPYRKVKINEPRYVVEVARFLAARRGMSLQAFDQAMEQNAARFFPFPQTSALPS